MLAAVVATSGLAAHLEHVISVDAVKTYKPHRSSTRWVLRRWRSRAGELLFVSSNAWDVAGAKAFGYRVAWCNRTSAPRRARVSRGPDRERARPASALSTEGAKTEAAREMRPPRDVSCGCSPQLSGELFRFT